MKSHEGLLPCPTSDGLTERLERLAEWYESGPSYPREFEEGRQRIASDLRAALAALSARTPSPSGARETVGDINADMNDEIVGMVRAIAKRLTGGNCTFADDDLRAIEALAQPFESALRSQGRGEGE